MVRPLSLAEHVLYADLLEQGVDDLFDPDLPENGSILIRPNRASAQSAHAYYQGYRPAAGYERRGQRFARYLGRADDPEVVARIARFQRVKAVRAERVTTVRALIGAGMPRPDRMTGRIIEALARAGLFPGHAVLIGEAAYQTYDGVLGVRLAKPPKATTSDRPTLEIIVRDGRHLAKLMYALRAVDPSFTAELADTASYRSATGIRVAVTISDRVNDPTKDQISSLITNPVESLVLYGPGIPVTVPAPERFVVHAQITRSTHTAMIASLIEALRTSRSGYRDVR